MENRLGTSSGRPRTGNRPGTAFSDQYPPSYTIPRTANSEEYDPRSAYAPHFRQYQEDLYEEEEEEEEEEEDVFAYLPPSTAEQLHAQREALAREQQQPLHPSGDIPPQSPIDPALDFFVDSAHTTVPSPPRDRQDASLHIPQHSHFQQQQQQPSLYNHPPPKTTLSATSSSAFSNESSFDGIHGPDAYKMRSLNSAMRSPPPTLTNTTTPGTVPIPVSRIIPGSPVGTGGGGGGGESGGHIRGGYLANTIQTPPSAKEVRVTFPASSESPDDKPSPLGAGGPESLGVGRTRQDDAETESRGIGLPHDRGHSFSSTTKDLDMNDTRSSTRRKRRKDNHSPGRGGHPPMTPSRKMTFDSLGLSDLSGLPGEDYGDDVDLVDRIHGKTALSSYSDTEAQSNPGHHQNGQVAGYPSFMDSGIDRVGDEEDSPYPEVRASVSNLDDPEMPVLTIRMWILGLTLCSLAAGANTFFNFRYPAPLIASMVLLLIAHPCGKFLAYSLPINTYMVRFPLWMNRVLFWREPSVPFEYEINLNPGPFNIKEHVLIYIMTNVSVFPAYAMNAFVVADLYYGIHRGFGFRILLVLGNQLAGFGIAGICRRFLVWPASLIWPQNLVVCTLLNTLHAEDDEQGSGISRYKFYVYVSIAAFFYYFFPGFLFQALSVFSWVCWIKPNNIPINQLFGVSSGLGMGILSFDWTQIGFLGSPLMIPWWAEVHMMIGFVLLYWIIGPILYYTDVWHFAHLPIVGSQPYDRYGQPYNISQVLSADNTLDEQAYNNYSHLYITLNYAITYLMAFALCTCLLTHTALYHGSAMLRGLKRAKIEEDDIHAKLMKYYPEVPDWWYGSVFTIFFIMGLLAVAVFHTGVPVWSLFLAVVLPLIYVLPSGFVYAYTGQSISINVLSEALAGLIFPGKPFTNMMFKAYSVQTIVAAINFVQDLKLGHYIKVPPRATFTAQMVATMLTAAVQVAVQAWLFSHQPDMCTPHQKNHLTCPQTAVYYTASVIWGVIGPTRQFGSSALYRPELWAILIGALLPIPFWLWQRRFPNTRLKMTRMKMISMPVLLNGPAQVPPALGINFSSWFVVAFIFQYVVRRRNFRWWSKFNYILSAALDSGTLISVLVVFFTLQFPKDGNIQVNWWGNTVFANTVDGQGDIPLLSTDPQGFD